MMWSTIQLLASQALLVVMTTTAAPLCTKMEAYNVGLSTSVPNKESRTSRIIDALKSSTSDFVCLQEVWMETDVRNILEELQSVFPFHYTAIHAEKNVLGESASIFPLKKTSCNGFESASLLSGVSVCALFNGCVQKSGYALGECVSQNCGSVLSRQSINENCVSCYFLNAFNSVRAAVTDCSIPKSKDNRLNGPGLLVLSKSDMTSVSYVNYFPGRRQIFQRGYIQAELQNKLTTVCTHMSSNVPAYLEYDLDFENYKSQQKAEINKLNVTFNGQDIVLLGDLNMGPRITGNSDPEKNVDGEFLENYDLLLSYGFRSPYVSQDGRCTFCTNNSLIDDYPNQILDHVMIKDTSTYSTKGETRLYDELDPPLSDHYGIKVEVCE